MLAPGSVMLKLCGMSSAVATSYYSGRGSFQIASLVAGTSGNTKNAA
jgi:hypothetical protein